MAGSGGPDVGIPTFCSVLREATREEEDGIDGIGDRGEEVVGEGRFDVDGDTEGDGDVDRDEEEDEDGDK